MLKTLLKKQLIESFQNFFVSKKSGKKKKPIATALMLVAYAILMFFAIGSGTAMLSSSLSFTLVTENSFIFFLFSGVYAIFLGIFCSVFMTFSSVYSPRDNDLLLSLPIPVSKIIFSRILSCIIVNELYILPAFLPPAAFCLMVRGVNAKNIISLTVFFIVISALTFAFSAFLSYLVGLITSRVKRKDIVTSAVMILFLAVTYPLFFKIEDIISFISANIEKISLMMRTKLLPLYWFGQCGDGNVKLMVIYTVVSILLCVGICVLMSRSFLKITANMSMSATEKGRHKSYHKMTLTSALIKKEFKRFFSSPTYVLNCSMGSIMTIFLAVFALFDKGYIASLIKTANLFLGTEDSTAVLVCVLETMFMAINTVSACSISTEGKSFWTILSSPVRKKDIFFSKIFVHFVISSIPCLISSCVLFFKLSVSPVDAAIGLIFILNASAALGSFGLLMNLRFNALDYKNEAYAVKQGWNIILSMMFGIISAVISAGIFILLTPPTTVFLVILNLIFLSLNGLEILILSRKKIK